MNINIQRRIPLLAMPDFLADHISFMPILLAQLGCPIACVFEWAQVCEGPSH